MRGCEKRVGMGKHNKRSINDHEHVYIIVNSNINKHIIYIYNQSFDWLANDDQHSRGTI